MDFKTAQEEEAFSQQNTYTPDEKKYIMERLDAERRVKQKKNSIAQNYTAYTDEEKTNILNELNERRLEEQIYKEIKKQRTFKKKIHIFNMQKFYKLQNMDREYFIRIEDMEQLLTRPQILTLYYRVFGELKKKDFLMKVMSHSNRVYVSTDMLRVYFKAYQLEDEW